MSFQSGIPVELPEPDSGVYPDDELGEELFNFGGMPNHLDGLLFKTPEGLALRCLCEICGGRREQIVVFKDTVPDWADASNASLQKKLQKEIVPRVQQWADEHEECPEHPISHQIPDKLAQHTRSIAERGREHLAETGILPVQVFLLLSDARELIIPFLLDLPDREEHFEAYITELELRKYAIRQHLRDQNVRILAATLFGQGESSRAEDDPIALPDNQEAVICQQVSLQFGRAGLAPVERSQEGSGPKATLGKMRWSGRTGPQPMLDGLVVPL